MIDSYAQIAKREAELAAFVLKYGTRLPHPVEYHGINLRSDGVMIDFHRKDRRQVEAVLGSDHWFWHPEHNYESRHYHKFIGNVMVRILRAEKFDLATSIFDALSAGNAEYARSVSAEAAAFAPPA